MKLSRSIVVLVAIFVATIAAYAGEKPSKTIPKNAKVFVAAMPDGFETYLKTAIEKKKVPLELSLCQ